MERNHYYFKKIQVKIKRVTSDESSKTSLITKGFQVITQEGKKVNNQAVLNMTKPTTRKYK